MVGNSSLHGHQLRIYRIFKLIYSDMKDSSYVREKTAYEP